MATQKIVESVPDGSPESAPATGVTCPYCNDTGFYRPADGGGDPRFDDPDFYVLCPYCKAASPEESRLVTPPDAPYDPQPKASGYELQIFGAVGVICLLIAAAIGVIRSISLAQSGAIPTMFHGHYAIGWVLLVLALVLLAGSIVWTAHLLHKRR